MNTSNQTRRLISAAGFGLGVMAVVLAAFGLFASSASASSAPADKPAPAYAPAAPATPSVTVTPRPIKLRPWVQFGHALPGHNAHYRQLLFNHLTEPTDVNLDGSS